MLDLDFRQFQDKAWEDKVPLIERSLSLLLDLGIYEGDRFLDWIRELFEAKTSTRSLTSSVTARRTKATATPPGRGLDVSKHELLVLPRDAATLGVEPDALDVGSQSE